MVSSEFLDGRSCPEAWSMLLEDLPLLWSSLLIWFHCYRHVKTPSLCLFHLFPLKVFSVPLGMARAARTYHHFQRGVVRIRQSAASSIPSHMISEEPPSIIKWEHMSPLRVYIATPPDISDIPVERSSQGFHVV